MSSSNPSDTYSTRSRTRAKPWGHRIRGPTPRSLRCPMRSPERAEPRLYFLGKEPRPLAYSPRPSSGYSRTFGSRSVRSGEPAECLCRDPADLRSSVPARQAGVRRARSRSRQSPRRPHAPALASWDVLEDALRKRGTTRFSLGTIDV